MADGTLLARAGPPQRPLTDPPRGARGAAGVSAEKTRGLTPAAPTAARPWCAADHGVVREAARPSPRSARPAAVRGGGTGTAVTAPAGGGARLAAEGAA